jgi:hypothetical protein
MGKPLSRSICLQTKAIITFPTRATYTKAYWFGEYYAQDNSWVGLNFSEYHYPLYVSSCSNFQQLLKHSALKILEGRVLTPISWK